jgi:hypothetical protein
MQQPNRFIIVLKEIWPTIYRGINSMLYFLFGVIRTGVKVAVQQLKGGGFE